MLFHVDAYEIFQCINNALFCITKYNLIRDNIVNVSFIKYEISARFKRKLNYELVFPLLILS